MSTRVSFADLLKKGAEKDNQKTLGKPALPVIDMHTLPTPPTSDTPPTKHTLPTKRTPPTPITKHSVSPERDFTKVANSIVREAVAQGLFIGKSKQIYDFLYLHTRGAIQPKRSVRITKSNLMRGASIGSERTLLKNLSHLKSTGLLKITEFDGQHGGNEYEIFLPEESHPTPPTPPTADQAHHALQKVGTVPPVESDVSGVTQSTENTSTYSDAKTSFKDNIKPDDDAHAHAGFSLMIERFNTVVKKLTGKKVTRRDMEGWGNLADLLILELEVAARHTENISSVPAFLTEVLRRKIFADRQHQSGKSLKASKAKIDTVGKPESETYEIKPLDEKGREAAVEQLREFAADDFLQDFKKWYTPEDWDWITKQLGIN